MKARATASRSSVGWPRISSRRSSACADGSAEPDRRRMAARRSCSTSSKRDSPSCSTMTWPSSAPMSFTSRDSGSRAWALPMPFGSARRAVSAAVDRGTRSSGSAESRGDASRCVVRLLGAGNDTASSVSVGPSREVPPGAVVPALEATATGDAGDRGEATVPDGEGREVTLNGDRLGEVHAASVRRRCPDVGNAVVMLGLRRGCDLDGALTGPRSAPRMRLQLQMATTGTSSDRTARGASRDGASRHGTTSVNGPASLAPKCSAH